MGSFFPFYLKSFLYDPSCGIFRSSLRVSVIAVEKLLFIMLASVVYYCTLEGVA